METPGAAVSPLSSQATQAAGFVRKVAFSFTAEDDDEISIKVSAGSPP